MVSVVAGDCSNAYSGCCIRYIDAVFPGEYGIPKPFYFFLMPSYWLGQPVKKQKVDDIEVTNC